MLRGERSQAVELSFFSPSPRFATAALVVLALVLAGCGGGLGSDGFQQNSPPSGGPGATIGGSNAVVPPPTISNVSPNSGDSTGGTTITISGANFQNGAIVRVGGKNATNVVVTNGSTITAVTAPNAPGTYEVQVINPDNQAGVRLGSFTYLAAPAPTIVQILPNSGPASGGTVVTISGSNFQQGIAVLFGGAAATSVTLVSSVQLTVTTPGALPGIVDVQVINPDSQTFTITGGYTFTSGPAPTILNVSPGSGASTGGTSVTITGTNFTPGAVVQFGGVTSSSVVVISATQITAIAPAHSIGLVNVAVRNPDNQVGTLTGAFNYLPPPSVTSVAPNSGAITGGTVVTITGSAFLGPAIVRFGGAAATAVNVLSATQIQATTPAHAAGSIDVVVTNPDGQTGTLSSGFTFNLGPPPSISSVAPISGPASGGTSVVITGTNFQAGASVAFGLSPAASATVNSATQITAVTPAGSGGAVDVTVTNPDGQVGTLTNGFNFLPAPTVTAVSPSTGPTGGGTAVSISGTGFLPGATVTFGATAATGVTVNSSTTILATSPAGAAGAVSVTVRNPDTQTGTLAGGFTYTAAPVVTSVSPSSGPVAGGTSVTITGANFVNGATVKFGVNSATGVVFNSATSITAVTPAGAAGAVTVTVTNPSLQSGSLPLGFSYTPPAPTVASVNPTNGAASGGLMVTITGTNFLANATVTFGGTASPNVTVVNATTIQAVTPAHAAGAVNVVVTNPDTQTGTLPIPNGYTFNAAPTVTSVAPNSGLTSGGTVVIINGTNFLSGATILFGSTPATGVVFLGTTQYQATTPAQTAGAVSVQVIDADGQNGTLASAFTFTAAPPPTVTSVAPNSGPAGGNTTITITGANFVNGAVVLVGGTSAANVILNSSTQMTAETPPHGAGSVSVQVRNPDGQIGTLLNGFTYLAAPTIASVTPNAGTTAGGTSITIAGTGFQAGATVNIAGVAASNVVVVSATSITADTPPGSAGNASVTVLNPDGQTALLTGGFSYTAPASPPIVTSVLPINGSQNGGTTVTITGTGFQSGATVQFGPNQATGVVVSSASSISAVTPAGTIGPVTVTVTNPDTQSGSLLNGFAYLISSVVITTTDLPDGNPQVPYTIGFAAFSGALPYRWTLASGTLPPGLALDATTGFLDGVPTQTGSFSFTIVASDSATPAAQTATANFTLNIVPVPTGPNLPVMPQAYVDTTMPVQTGTVRNVTACNQLQSTIDAAALGDTIVINSSLTCVGQFILREKTTGSGWIIIQSSAMASLPPPGTRIDPVKHAQFMPKLQTPSSFNGRIISAALRAHHYRLIGLELGFTPGSTGGTLLNFDPGAGIISDFPSFLIADRMYIHGNPTLDAKRGVQIGANNVAIIDSYISDIHAVGVDSQAFGGWNFQGPLKVVNNFLSAAAEGFILGGSAPVIAGVVPSDIEIRRNHFFKPLSWRVGDPSYAGIHWMEKNGIEIKDAQRVLFEGNVVENNWADAQVGFMANLKSEFQSNTVPQAQDHDLIMRHNFFTHGGGWLTVLYTSAGDTGSGPEFPPNVLCNPLQVPAGCIRTRVFHIHDNIVEDVNATMWGGTGTAYQITGPTDDIFLENNTIFQSGLLMCLCGPDPTSAANRFSQRFVFNNNLVQRGNGGIKGGGSAEGNASLNFQTPGFTLLKNVIVGATAAAYPTNNFYPAGPLPSNIGFVNFNNGIGGDYRLLPTSPYKNAGTNGKDIGARAGATVAAVTGVN